MAITKILNTLPSLRQIEKILPIDKELTISIKKHIVEISSILMQKDKRLIIIVGPCSAWPTIAVMEYAKLLAELQRKVKETIKIVMRVYIAKPRTIVGWRGLLYQPNPLEEVNFVEGLCIARELMINIAKLDLAIADEALFLNNSKWFLPLISWLSIGARSNENTEHRLFASMLDLPVGLKNPTNGNIESAVNAVIVAQQSGHYIFNNKELITSGNHLAHLVLRGGGGINNCSLNDLLFISKLLFEKAIINPSMIIDVSHDNSIVNGQKNFRRQLGLIQEIMTLYQNYSILQQTIKGFMLESFLLEGSQELNPSKQINFKGLSITDQCLDFNSTAECLLNLHQQLLSII